MSASDTDDVEFPIDNLLNILSKSEARFFVSAMSHFERRLKDARFTELLRSVTLGVWEPPVCSGDELELLESAFFTSIFLTSLAGLSDTPGRVVVVLSVSVPDSSVW